MKKIIIFAGISLLGLQAYAQKVPASVQKAFDQKFPNTKGVKWEKEKKSYEAEFMSNGKEVSAEFSPEGQWLQTEREIQINELPAAIQTAIKSKFAGYNLKEAEIVENKNGKNYQVELLKGKEEIEAQFSENGTLLSQEKETKEKNDD